MTEEKKRIVKDLLPGSEPHHKLNCWNQHQLFVVQ